MRWWELKYRTESGPPVCVCVKRSQQWVGWVQTNGWWGLGSCVCFNGPFTLTAAAIASSFLWTRPLRHVWALGWGRAQMSTLSNKLEFSLRALIHYIWSWITEFWNAGGLRHRAHPQSRNYNSKNSEEHQQPQPRNPRWLLRASAWVKAVDNNNVQIQSVALLLWCFRAQRVLAMLTVSGKRPLLLLLPQKCGWKL